MRLNQKAMAILSVVGMAGTAWGQVNTWELIGFKGPGKSVEDAFRLSHTISVSGGSISLAKVTAIGDALVVTLPMGNIPGHADICEDLGPCDTDGDFKFISGNWSTSTIDTAVGEFKQANATGDCGLYSELDIARAMAHIGAFVGIDLLGRGVGVVEHAMRRANLDCCWINESPSCCKTGKTSLPEWGTALIGALHGYEISRSPSTPVTVTIDFEVIYEAEGRSDSFPGWGPGPHCAVGETCPPSAELDDFIISITLTGRAVKSSGVSERSYGGALVVNDDGTFRALGFLDDVGFDPSTGSASLVFDDVFNGLIDEVEVDYKIKSILASELASGDVDGDGTVCGNDRVAFMAALGSSIGDENYNIRADFNLDGHVDLDDLAHLNTIGCTADFDCDGDLTIFDQTAFANLFAAEDPAADFDGDGLFTVFDFTAFGNVFALGCP